MEETIPKDIQQFMYALELAVRLHYRQFRKSRSPEQIPYITHLLAVTALVGEHGGTWVEMTAAVLHDAIEDQGGTALRPVLADRFGADVLAIVDGCTDAEQPQAKPPWRERKEAHLMRLTHATPSIWLVLLADKYHNCQSLLEELQLHSADDLWHKFKGGREGTIWYYQAFLAKAPVETFSVPLRRLWQKFQEAVEQLERTGS